MRLSIMDMYMKECKKDNRKPTFEGLNKYSNDRKVGLIK